MNRKIKALAMATLVLGVLALAIHVSPTLAYMNGATDQTRDRDMDQTKDCTCDCTCDQIQNQTRTRLHLQQCVQNQTSLGPVASENQYEQQHRHQHKKGSAFSL